jgi:hypothetical protein
LEELRKLQVSQLFFALLDVVPRKKRVLNSAIRNISHWAIIGTKTCAEEYEDAVVEVRNPIKTSVAASFDGCRREAGGGESREPFWKVKFKKYLHYLGKVPQVGDGNTDQENSHESRMNAAHYYIPSSPANKILQLHVQKLYRRIVSKER